MNTLQVIIKTPLREVMRMEAISMRVVCATGQVGLRPRMEPLVLAVEAGLAILQAVDQTLYIGTPGGLLRCDGRTALFLTPLAVAAEHERQVLAALAQQLDQPSAEMEVRNMISKIQKSVLNELEDDRRSGIQKVEVI